VDFRVQARRDIVSRIAIMGGMYLAGSGDHFVDGGGILLDGEKIVGKGHEALAAGDAVRIVDGTGKYILPGLIDSHFHLVSRTVTDLDEFTLGIGVVEGVINAQERLRAGVTTVRDCGCRHHGIHALTTAIRARLVDGPRTYSAGRNPTGPAAPSHWRNVIVRDSAEMRAAVKAELEAGADWVKFVLSHAENPANWGAVTPYLDEDVVRAGVETAHDAGVRVSVHVEGYEVAAMAVRCGVDAMEHAPQVDEATAEAMADKGIVYVPTLWAFADDTGLNFKAMSSEDRQGVKYWQAEHRASVRRALEAGVCIAAGSDAAASVPPRDVLVREMRALASAGLPPGLVLQAATINGARALGLVDQVGSLAIGAWADVIVVDKDPLENLSALEHPSMVIANGIIMHDGAEGGLSETSRDGESKELIATASRWV
jgi:imidazolonepropionase-like amidohydrolase